MTDERPIPAESPATDGHPAPPSTPTGETASPDATAAGRGRGIGPNYRKLLGSAAAANLGDGLKGVAMVWLASAVTRDPLLISLVGVAGFIPWLFFSLPAGVIGDRFDRRKLIGWMDITRAVVMVGLAALVLAFQAELPSPEQLAAGAPEPPSAALLVTALTLASLLLGCAEVLRDNTAQTMMPMVVPKASLERANGRMWAAESTMNNFVGPPLGGVLIAVALALPFFINAGLLAVSAALVFSLVGTFRPAGDTLVRARTIDWRTEIGEGFSWLWQHRLIRSLAFLLGLLNMFGNIAFATMVLFVQEVLGLFDGWQFGLVTTGVAVGAVVGSLIAHRVSARLGPGASLLVAVAGQGVFVALTGLSLHPVMFWLCGLFSGIFIVIWNVVTVSLRQRLIPDRLLGRVNSVYRLFGWGTISIGTLLGGALITVGQTFLPRDVALRAVVVAAGIAHLTLLAYIAARVNNRAIRAAEADAEPSPLTPE